MNAPRSSTVAPASGPQSYHAIHFGLEAGTTADPNATCRSSPGIFGLAAQNVLATSIASILIGSISACSFPRDLGPRGDARLYLDAAWPMHYPRLELNAVPLDVRRSYALRITGFREWWNAGSFHVEVITEPVSNSLLRSASESEHAVRTPEHPVVRLRVIGEDGKVYTNSIVGSARQQWMGSSEDHGLPVLKSCVSWWEKIAPGTRGPGSDFTVIIEILRPSNVQGQRLRIYSP